MIEITLQFDTAHEAKVALDILYSDAAAPTAPAAPTAEETVIPTAQELSEKMREKAQKHGADKLYEIIQSFGVSGIAEMSDTMRSECLAKVSELS